MPIAIEIVQPVPLTQTPEGVIRITGTRVPLDTILHNYNRGASAEEITNRFPAVSLSQVHAILAYYLSHRAELDAYLKEQEALDAAFLKQLEADPKYQADRIAFRERLMQRRAERQGQLLNQALVCSESQPANAGGSIKPWGEREARNPG